MQDQLAWKMRRLDKLQNKRREAREARLEALRAWFRTPWQERTPEALRDHERVMQGFDADLESLDREWQEALHGKH